MIDYMYWKMKCIECKNYSELLALEDELNEKNVNFIYKIGVLTYATNCILINKYNLCDNTKSVLITHIEFLKLAENYQLPKIIYLDQLLYPQYEEDHANRKITSEEWKYIQLKAAELLSIDRGSEKVREHWLSIVNGNIPFGYILSDE